MVYPREFIVSDLTVDILCFLYVTLLVFTGFLLYRYAKWRSEGVRKFIHILTSLIIIPCQYCVISPSYRVALPFVFIFINTFAVLSNMIEDLGMKDKKRNYGLILYPVAVTVVVAAEALGIIEAESAIAGTLMLGLGDGAAAIVGKMWGKHTYILYNGAKRSLEGSFTMALVSTSVVLIFTSLPLSYGLLIGIIAALVEAFSPSSIDNILVPVAGSAVVELFLHLV